MTTATAARSNVQIVRHLYDAFASGDIPALLANFDPQMEWVAAEGAPYPGTFLGPNDILTNLFARLSSEWDGFRAQPAEVLDAGEHVVVLGRYFGTYKETGRSMSAAFAHVWTVRDGRVFRLRQYADTRKIAEAL